MAGHSKWANIKHRKGAQDKRRSKLFTKIIKDLTIAARAGGPDPDANPRLRLALQNAKGANVPKENIERAIKKATGEGSSDYTEVTYEGYGPSGVAIFVEAATDNLTRTVQNVRSLLNKYGGSLGTNGSLSFIFDRKGIFTFPLENRDEDELTLELIDSGASEVEVYENTVMVTTSMEDFGKMQQKLEEEGIETETARLERIPVTTVSASLDEAKKVMKLIDALEDDDDVQNIYHNLELTEELENALSE